MTGPGAARGRRLLGMVAPAAVLVVIAVLLSGCSLVPANPQTTLEPHSDNGQKIQDLFALTVWLAVGVGVVVEAGLLFAVLRFRRRPSQTVGAPTGIHGSTRLEVTWTILPTLVLVVLAVLTVPVIFQTAEAAPKGAMQVNVVAHQWWWEFDYPQYGFKTANELHIPTNQTTNFSLTSNDVIHSFWIPGMDGKRDVFPNHTNTIWFTPNKNVTGRFPGQCAEFCGPSHGFMYMMAVVDSQKDFASWVKRQQAKAVVPANASAEIKRGAQVFAQGACAGCHAISGTAAQGAIGPNLTHIGSRFNLSGQLMPNTPANLARWIHNASDFKTGSHMPPQNLSQADLSAVVAYLESLK